VADIEIPITNPDRGHIRQRTTLDGVEYVLCLRWSQREGKWYLDIRDADGRMRLGSIKVVSNYPLLAATHGRPGLPLGELYAVDRRQPARDPGLDDLGSVVRLFYTEASSTV
jgi:hypothetical protein